MSTGKASNPKDAAATDRIPNWLLSPVAKIKWAVAQAAGAFKYGAWNWRIAGVRASVYLSAAERHLDAWKSGEKVDPVDGTHHLGNVMACCAILLDAEACGQLVDDRPPSVTIRQAVAEGEGVLKALRTKYAHIEPRHYNIADTHLIPRETLVKRMPPTCRADSVPTVAFDLVPDSGSDEKWTEYRATSLGGPDDIYDEDEVPR